MSPTATAFRTSFSSTSRPAQRHGSRTGRHGDAGARFSPDGKQLAFVRGAKELRVLDVASKEERVLASGFLDNSLDPDRTLAWSPDGKWIAFIKTSAKLFSNVEVVPAAGGASHPISFLANVFGGSVTWSPDGTYLLFDTGQRTEPRQLVRIDLTPRAPKFTRRPVPGALR